MKKKIIWFLSPVSGQCIMSGNLRRISYWWEIFKSYADLDILLLISGPLYDTKLKEAFEKLGLRVEVLSDVYPFYKTFYGKGKDAMQRLLSREQPDIVHSLLVQADIIAAFFKPKFNYIHISSLEGALFPQTDMYNI